MDSYEKLLRKGKSLNKCFYHKCEKHGNIFERCDYCNQLFCKNHIEAKPRVMPSSYGSSRANRLVIEEIRNPNAHACSIYGKRLEGDTKMEKENYSRALESLLKRETKIGTLSQSKTEKKLLKAMNKIGLYPKEQYRIGSVLHVDFAFQEQKVAIEIDGPHHRTSKYIEIDRRRDFFVKSKGWKIKRYLAEEAWGKPEKVAAKIKKFVYDGDET